MRDKYDAPTQIQNSLINLSKTLLKHKNHFTIKDNIKHWKGISFIGKELDSSSCNILEKESGKQSYKINHKKAAEYLMLLFPIC